MRITAKILHRTEYNGFVQSIFSKILDEGSETLSVSENKKSITMKLLQNNFTSPEQSRRLLDLGLPADSADCYWHFIRRNEHTLLRTELRWLEPPYVDKYTAFVDMAVGHDKYRANRLKTYLPCWSVGRLIEISIICGNTVFLTKLHIDKYSLNPSLVEDIIHRLERVVDLGVNDIDFSKLED